MKRIVPCLWFDNRGEEAAKFYTSIFDRSKIGPVLRYGKEGFEIHKRPEGSVMTVEFELEGLDFLALNGGPLFEFTPAISFLIACKTKEEVISKWEKLSQNATVMMELGEYPFSAQYGWLADQYGVSWQVMFVGDHKVDQKIIPTFMFVGDVCGKAEQAMSYYASIFPNSKIGGLTRYKSGEEPDKPGTIKLGTFTLDGQQFNAMDSAYQHQFNFNEALSLQVMCKTQDEIDYYWNMLSAVPESEQCGWLKDQFGVSWQIVPEGLAKLFRESDPIKSERIMKAMLQMAKLDIAALERA